MESAINELAEPEAVNDKTQRFGFTQPTPVQYPAETAMHSEPLQSTQLTASLWTCVYPRVSKRSKYAPQARSASSPP